MRNKITKVTHTSNKKDLTISKNLIFFDCDLQNVDLLCHNNQPPIPYIYLYRLKAKN